MLIKLILLAMCVGCAIIGGHCHRRLTDADLYEVDVAKGRYATPSTKSWCQFGILATIVVSFVCGGYVFLDTMHSLDGIANDATGILLLFVGGVWWYCWAGNRNTVDEAIHQREFDLRNRTSRW